MSMVRLLLLSLAALLFAPAAAHAEDDEVCLGWVHVFTIEREHEILEMESQDTCLAHGTSIEELEPEGKSKPYRGHYPEWTKEKECKALERQIEEMRRVLAEAKNRLPGAIAARDAAAGEKNAAVITHTAARDIWERAMAALIAARSAYEQVYEVEVEIERADGEVVVVRRIGYDASSELGRKLIAAIEAEARAREAMEAAFAALGAANPKAQVAQFNVDHYTSIINTYPGAIDDARAYAAEIGCQ